MNTWLPRVLSVACATLLVWLIVHPASPLLSQGASGASPPVVGDLQVFTQTLSSGVQQLVVVESSTRSMAVYHVEPIQGKLQLRSVRNLRWDLRMEQFNGQSPLPAELRQVEP